LAYIGRILDRLADDVAAMRQQLTMLNARLERIVERHEAMNREVERFSISPMSPASAGSVRDEFETAPVPLHRPAAASAHPAHRHLPRLRGLLVHCMRGKVGGPPARRLWRLWGRARLAEAEALARIRGGEIRRAAFAFPPAAPPGESRDQQAAK
jgi:hypothetical protein